MLRQVGNAFQKKHLNSTLKKEYECEGKVQLSGREATMCKDICPGRQDGLRLSKEQGMGRERSFRLWGDVVKV